MILLQHRKQEALTVSVICLLICDNSFFLSLKYTLSVFSLSPGTSCWWHYRTVMRSSSTGCWRQTLRSSCLLFTPPPWAWPASSMAWPSGDPGEGRTQVKSSKVGFIASSVEYHILILWVIKLKTEYKRNYIYHFTHINHIAHTSIHLGSFCVCTGHTELCFLLPHARRCTGYCRQLVLPPVLVLPDCPGFQWSVPGGRNVFEDCCHFQDIGWIGLSKCPYF